MNHIYTKVKLVVATRESIESFASNTHLGRSIRILSQSGIEPVIFYKNSYGLPRVYNQVIDASRDDPSILMFAHDDLNILNFDLRNAVHAGLKAFDIIGIAGNKRRIPNQPGWAFTDINFSWDSAENLSGIVGHGSGYPPENLSVYGPWPHRVKLIDGVFMACKSSTLIDQEIRFDESFNFHFYDLDLCRQAEQKNLRIGTWPISVIHESGGAYGSAEWMSSYRSYLNKWGG